MLLCLDIGKLTDGHVILLIMSTMDIIAGFWVDVKSITYNIIGYPVRFSIIKFQSITRIILSGHASSIFYREVMSLCEIENIEKSGLSMKY